MHARSRRPRHAQDRPEGAVSRNAISMYDNSRLAEARTRVSALPCPVDRAPCSLLSDCPLADKDNRAGLRPAGRRSTGTWDANVFNLAMASVSAGRLAPV